MKVKMVVFDMAGTTVDEGNVVYRTLHHAIEKKAPHIRFEDVLKSGAGKEKLQAIRDTLLDRATVLTKAEVDSIFQDFLESLDLAYKELVVTPTKNTEKLVKELRELDIIVVLNTGYNRVTATSLIQKLNWEQGVHYDLLVTASDVKNNRPKPDMILYAMDQFAIQDAFTVVKVGDSTVDIEEGKNAGCLFTIGVTTGAHTKAELLTANPDYILDDIYDLKKVILSLNPTS
jgi:phosphonatase-like hydrolase